LHNPVKTAYSVMRTGRPKKPLEVTDEDCEKLRMMALRPKSAQAMAMRARIVLSCEQGMSNSEVARKLHVTGATVGKEAVHKLQPIYADTDSLDFAKKHRIYRR
jgi:hypothetical protein